jgi:hypothetical protein
MKILKTFLFGLLITMGMAHAITAQTIDQGTWMIGGSAGFSSTKVKNIPASTNLDLSPKFGLFIIDDLAVGLGISYKSTSSDGSSNSTFGLGPFVRYYLTDPIFVQAGVDLGLEEDSATSFSLSLGYSWFVDNTVAIEPALFFSSVNYDGESSDATIFGLSIGIQAFAGR